MLRRDDERGFTLVELTVAMTLMLLVAGALLGALESGTRAERVASTRIDDEQSVRVVLAQLTRDVRNAQAVNNQVLLPGTTADEIDLEVDGVHVRWWYDSTAHVLTRKAVDDVTSAVVDGVSIGGLTDPPGTTFALLAGDGSNLLSLQSASLDDVLTCTATVEVAVTSGAHRPSRPFTETADAPVNAVADRRGCP